MEGAQHVLVLARRHREACERGSWDLALDVAVSLGDALRCADAAACMEGSDCEKVLWSACSSARTSLLRVTSSFGAHAHRSRHGASIPSNLALAVASSCAVLMPDVWLAGAADDLLSMAGAVAALLRIAVIQASGFAVLRARRAAGELLAALLEAASPRGRQRAESALLRDTDSTGAMESLVEVLLDSPPDPCLHETLLEILWRSLRRVGAGAALAALATAHPALILLENRQPGLSGRIQTLTPEGMLHGAQDMALELSASSGVSLLDCRTATQQGVAVFTAFSMSFYQEGEADPVLEYPWEALELEEVREVTDSSSSVRFVVDTNVLNKLTTFIEGDKAEPCEFEVLFEAPEQDVHGALQLGGNALQQKTATVEGSNGSASLILSSDNRLAKIEEKTENGMSHSPVPSWTSSVVGQVPFISPRRKRSLDGSTQDPAEKRPFAHCKQFLRDSRSATNMVGERDALSAAAPDASSVPRPTIQDGTPWTKGGASERYLERSGSTEKKPPKRRRVDRARSPLAKKLAGRDRSPSTPPPAACHVKAHAVETPGRRKARDVTAVNQREDVSATAPNASSVPRAFLRCKAKPAKKRWVQDFQEEVSEFSHGASGAAPDRERRHAAAHPRAHVQWDVTEQKDAPTLRHRGRRKATHLRRSFSTAPAISHVPRAAHHVDRVAPLAGAAAQRRQSEAECYSVRPACGYAALTTNILRSLCKSRSLPWSGEREVLIQQLRSKHPTSRTAQPKEAGVRSETMGSNSTRCRATDPYASRQYKQSTEDRVSPHADVMRVVHATTQLANDTAKVQRIMKNRQLLVDASASKANGLLDEITSARSRPTRSQRSVK